MTAAASSAQTNARLRMVVPKRRCYQPPNLPGKREAAVPALKKETHTGFALFGKYLESMG